MIVPSIGMVLVELAMFPAQIAVVSGVLAGQPIAFSVGPRMLLFDAVMIAIMFAVIALMLIAVIIIVIAMGECGHGRQGEKQRCCDKTFLHVHLLRSLLLETERNLPKTA